MAFEKAVDADQGHARCRRFGMFRSKICRHHPVIRVVAEINPQIDGPDYGADGASHRNDFALELRLQRPFAKSRS